MSFSRSAKVLTESLVSDHSFEDWTFMDTVFENLGFLVRGLESDILKPFLVDSFRNDIELAFIDSGNPDLSGFRGRVARVREAILQLDAAEMKEHLFQTVEIIHDDIPDEAEEMFETLLDAICELPTANLERMTSFNQRQKVKRKNNVNPFVRSSFTRFHLY